MAEITNTNPARPVIFPEGYKELNPGDIIQDGDLLLPHNKSVWKNVSSSIGTKYKETCKLNPASIVARKVNIKPVTPEWKPNLFSMYVIGAGASSLRKAEVEEIRQKYLSNYYFGGSSGNDLYILHNFNGRFQIDFYKPPQGIKEPWKRESCFNDAKIMTFDEFLFHFMSPKEKNRSLQLDLTVKMRETNYC